MNPLITKKLESFEEKAKKRGMGGIARLFVKSFFAAALQEAYEAGKKEGEPERILTDLMAQRIYYDTRLQTFQEAVEIGEKLKKWKQRGIFIESDNNYNQAITEYQGRLQEKIKEIKTPNQHSE